MHECQPSSLRVIWADSLTKYEQSVTPTGFPTLTLRIPFLASFISKEAMKIELPEPKQFLPLEELIDRIDHYVISQSGKQSLQTHLQDIGGKVSDNLGVYIINHSYENNHQYAFQWRHSALITRLSYEDEFLV